MVHAEFHDAQLANQLIFLGAISRLLFIPESILNVNRLPFFNTLHYQTYNNGNYKHGLSQTPEYTAARESKHRATKRNQTPINADPIKIQKIYSYCAKLNEVGFFRYEVDHIKPLSKSGLHHQDNLQILLAMLNHEKSDKWPLTKLERLKYKGITLKDLF